MEAHAACEGFISTRWRRVLEWFWATVGRMEQLELSQLLQFATGTSQLPAGGFAKLSPPLLLTPAFSTEADRCAAAEYPCSHAVGSGVVEQLSNLHVHTIMYALSAGWCRTVAKQVSILRADINHRGLKPTFNPLLKTPF
jgi:hypothetical protein